MSSQKNHFKQIITIQISSEMRKINYPKKVKKQKTIEEGRKSLNEKRNIFKKLRNTIERTKK